MKLWMFRGESSWPPVDAVLISDQMIRTGLCRVSLSSADINQAQSCTAPQEYPLPSEHLLDVCDRVCVYEG